MLVWSVALSLALIVPYACAFNWRFGLAEGFGNRDTPRQMTGWAGRAQRAHRNMLESLPAFAALVLAAQATGKFSALTGFAAQLFFFARVAHALIYIAGIPVLRSVAWLTGLVGLILLVIAILT